jgi:hypothetical protein
MSAGRVQVGREFESYDARTRDPILNSATPELPQLLNSCFIIFSLPETSLRSGCSICSRTRK